MSAALEAKKEIVRRLVDGVINSARIHELEELFAPSAAKRARRDFDAFRAAFPDWRMEMIELVAEDETVVARLKCHGTHEGSWRGSPPTDKKMQVDEVFFFRFQDGRINEMWGLEDTWTRMRQLGLVATD